MTRLTAACLLLSAALPTGALADPTMECPGSSQIEIGVCVSAALEAVDLAIESALDFARAGAAELDVAPGNNRAATALDAAQAAWSAYRDAQCEFIGAGFGGGSGTGIAITACRVTLGRARVDELLDAVN